MGCPFCNIDKRLLLFETEHTAVVANLFPAVNGHLLVVPKAHVISFTDLEDNQLTDLMITAKKAAIVIKELSSPRGMNGIFNEGTVAGQTIDHFHFNIIPRNNEDNIENLKRKNTERLPICDDDRLLLKRIFDCKLNDGIITGGRDSME